MPRYKYTAIDDQGRKSEGVQEAENEKALESILAERGYYLLGAEEVRELVKVQTKGKSYPKKAEAFQPEIIPQQGEDTAKEVHYHQHVHYHTPGQETPRPWSDLTVWTILWLIFFWPIGLYLLWRKEHTPQWFKTAMTTSMALWGLLYLPFSGKSHDKTQRVIPAPSVSYNKPKEIVSAPDSSIIPYKILHDKDIPRVIRTLYILVSPQATQEDVLRLTRDLLVQYDEYPSFYLQIFDNQEAYSGRSNPAYPEKEYWRHFLVDVTRNASTGYNSVNWVAEGRGY